VVYTSRCWNTAVHPLSSSKGGSVLVQALEVGLLRPEAHLALDLGDGVVDDEEAEEGDEQHDEDDLDDAGLRFKGSVAATTGACRVMNYRVI
jgi:hypothetical protein